MHFLNMALGNIYKKKKKKKNRMGSQKRSSNIKKRGYRADLWAAFGKRGWCSCIFAKRGSKIVYSRDFVNAA